MMEKIETKTEALIREYNMIQQGDVVIAGVSGGADSVCLLFVLCSLRKKLGFSVKVCHVNHGLRGEAADADERFVKGLCRKLDVPCRIFHKNVELIARKRKQSSEEAGRAVRRESFEIMCREDGGTKIATAHHRDDNAETVLLNLARGTGLRGLCGIRPVYGNWIRPLLGVSREEIETALVQAEITWRKDGSNEEDIYTRNRIRHNILPVFCAQINAETVRHLDELSRQSQNIWAYLMQGVDEAWKRCVDVRAGEPAVLEIRERALAEEAPAVRQQLIHRCICTAAGMSRDVEAVHVSGVQELFGRQPGKQISLPHGVTALRTYRGVALEKHEHQKSGDGPDSICPKELAVPGETYIPGTSWIISCRIYERTEQNAEVEIPQKSYTKCFDYDIIKHTPSARRRQPGDYLVIGKDGGRQKLKSYFINEKVPRRERDQMLLIADGSHVMWIPGMRMSAEYQISKETKRILEIKITEEKTDGRENQSSDPGRRGGSEN